MKQVIQLDSQGYFAGFSMAEESPLEPGVWLMPGGCIEAIEPEVPDGHRARWDGHGKKWIYETITQHTPELAPETEDDKIALCKSVAARLLLATDFSQYADVMPLLINYDEFVEYRSSVRSLFLKPVADPVWPALPTADWK